MSGRTSAVITRGGGGTVDGLSPRPVRQVRILFLHREVTAIERCLRELRWQQWRVHADVVHTPRQWVSRLAALEDGAPANAYDLVMAESPLPRWGECLTWLREVRGDIPLILVRATVPSRRTILKISRDPLADWVELDRVARLPGLVRCTLEQALLRLERSRAQESQPTSAALRRAVVAASHHGMARDGQGGWLADANRAPATISGSRFGQALLEARHREGWALVPPSPVPTGIHLPPAALERAPQGGKALEVACKGRADRSWPGATSGRRDMADVVTRQRELIVELWRRASIDYLTGLANYHRLLEVLGQETSRSSRTKRSFGVLLLDVDGLKQINDRDGHLAGNRVLCRLAAILTRCCRSADTAFRFGGDEFAVVLPESNAAMAEAVKQRIRERCSSESAAPLLSVSIGAANYPSDGRTMGRLLRSADRALYQEKAQSPLARALSGQAVPYLHGIVRPVQELGAGDVAGRSTDLARETAIGQFHEATRT